MKRIPRQIFTAEFKREVIKLVTERGLTLAEASRKLTANQQRIRELERDLAIAKMERDNFKKPTKLTLHCLFEECHY